MSKEPALHTLYLIPWHIGITGDLTYGAVRLARRLKVFLGPPRLQDRHRRLARHGVRG